jgi:osmotically-inducible protein OsmY
MLAADDFLKSFQIGVETDKGIVQLSGFVNSQKAIDKAVEITCGVKGVESVKNDLVVK